MVMGKIFFIDFFHLCLYILKYPLIISHDSVAQLGEHHLDRVGVAGSNPVRVTIHMITETL